MKTLNFEVLRNHAPDLANTGGFAEMYIYTDPASSVVKLRIIAEQIVLHIIPEIYRPWSPNTSVGYSR